MDIFAGKKLAVAVDSFVKQSPRIKAIEFSATRCRLAIDSGGERRSLCVR